MDMSAVTTAATLAPEVVKTASGQSIFHVLLAILGTITASIFATWRIWLKGAPERELAKAALHKARSDADTAASDSETQLRSEMWRDIQSLKLSKEETSRRLTIAETKIIEQSSELGQLRFIVALVNSELERVSPGNAIAKQVRVIMEDLQKRATTSGSAEETGIMGDIMSKMCFIGDAKEGSQ